MNRMIVIFVLCLAVAVMALGGCKKKEGDEASSAESAINIEAITEDNAVEEADRLLSEIDSL